MGTWDLSVVAASHRPSVEQVQRTVLQAWWFIDVSALVARMTAEPPSTRRLLARTLLSSHPLGPYRKRRLIATQFTASGF